MELDTALLRQIEKSILLDTVYDERKISEQAMQPLLRERCCQALCAIRRVLDEDTPDEACFQKVEEIVRILRPSARMAVRGTIFEYKNRGGLSTPDLFIHSK